MKKRTAALLLGVMMAVTAASCGQGKEGEKGAANGAEGTEVTEETEKSVTAASSVFDLNAKDYVTLCDYSGFEVTISGDYVVDAEDVDAYFKNMLASNGPYYTADEEKTVIGEGDIVNVDYVGKLDGTAFEGGTAEKQNIDVYNNSSADGTVPYIEGFTEGLKGASVGDVLNCDVTFPENYGNADLAGKAVVFTFTVNSIQKEVTADNVDDQFVKEQFQADTVEEMKEQIRTYLESTASYNKKRDSYNAVQQYLVDNCTVDVPEDYLAARVSDYRQQVIADNCEGDESRLEEYLSTYYGKSVEEAEEGWRDGMKEGIALELIMEAIADELGTKVEEEAYLSFVEGAATGSGYGSVDDMYRAYGYGDRDYGEAYVRELYRYDRALDTVMEHVTVREEPVNDAADAAATEMPEENGTDTQTPEESVSGTEEM